MEIPKKIGIGIAMIIPAFVFGGAVWSWFGSWFTVFILEVVMVLLYSSIISGWPVAANQKT